MASFTSHIPAGKSASVRIIDSTSRIANFSPDVLMGPPMPGLDLLPDLCTWSFLVENADGRRILFDLGIPVDWQDMAPAVSDRLKSKEWKISLEEPTIDILNKHDIKPDSIEAIVWSHWHWDHIGNPSHFPPSTALIVGPGFKAEQLPAYPSNPTANIRESDFANREFTEISFTESQSLQISQFRAYDYFGDGSFYLLDTPGHTTGHLAGLVRTTSSKDSSRDTFIFMGGDLTHHSGELRPSVHLPLPSEIQDSQIPKLCSALGYPSCCPGSIFETLQSERGRIPATMTPFFVPTMGKDIQVAIETIEKTQVADADGDVFYVFAHDVKIRGVVDLFPKEANQWKEKGWREKLLWRFLEDFEVAAKDVERWREDCQLRR